MKKRKIWKWCLLLVSIALAITALFNLQTLRDITARQFKTISVINAVKRMEKALEESYPEDQFEFVSGSYTDAEGDDDDASYTGNYIVNGQEDNVISVVYSDKDYDNIWRGNVHISIQKKSFERKCSLAARLAEDYTALVKKEAWNELEPYLLNETDISVRSFYQNPDYGEELPENLQFGMKFDKNLDLDFEFCFMVQIYEEGTEEQTAESIIEILNKKEFSFVQYDFTFLSEEKLVHYIYDDAGNLSDIVAEKI